jgi:flavocytochrome c
MGGEGYPLRYQCLEVDGLLRKKCMENIERNEKWDECCDVLVVGSGIAGLAAAIEAHNAGRPVIVIEKMKGYGGNSTISDGVLAVPGTAAQEAIGIQDSPDLMFRDMMKAGLGLNHPALVKTVTENAADAYRWAVAYLGVEYQQRVDIFGGHSVPRCFTPHNRSGSAFIRRMLKKMETLGLQVRTRVFLEEILLDERRMVQGVVGREGYRHPDLSSGRSRRIRVGRGLVLAAGGFGSDVAFRSGQDPRLGADVGTTNRGSATAESLKEAIRVGALPVHLSWIQLGPWACPDEKGYGIGPDFASYIAYPQGLMVDPETGLRVVNELGDRKERADGILRTGHPCVVMVDAVGVDNSGHSVARCVKRGIVREFDSIGELARFYGMPAGVLEDTIGRFNGYLRQGEDPDFGKPFLSHAAPVSTPPYYAMRVWPKVHHTMGGVLIDEQARVLDTSRRPIPGFYAAGEVTGGVHGACRLGSCAVTECLVFGRIAGRNAAAGGI